MELIGRYGNLLPEKIMCVVLTMEFLLSVQKMFEETQAELKKAIMVLQESNGKHKKVVKDLVRKNNRKKIADFAKKKTRPTGGSNKNNVAFAESSPLCCDLNLNNDDKSDLLSAPLVSTPSVAGNKNAEELDSETETELEEESEEELDPYDYKAILGHRKSQGQMLVRVEYVNGKKEWVHIAFVHVDAKELLGEYTTKKQLTDDVWKAGKKDGDTIVAILGHKGGGKHQELKVLWNNGFLGWKPFAVVREMDHILVDKYLEAEGSE